MRAVLPKAGFNLASMALAILSLGLLAFTFRGAEKGLWEAWQTNEYSHGILLPFIALMLAWHRLTLFKPLLKPSWLGPLTLLLAGAFLLIGTLAAFEAAAEYGLIIALIALSFAFLGRRATRAMVPGFVYLFFAVPLPHIIYSTLSQDLQLISSTVGVAFLELSGIPVFQEGNIIDLGGYRLQVADACSGLRYLFPLMSFGYLAAYLLHDKGWKRLAVFFSVIPIAIVMNSLRIAVVGITVDLWGIGMAEGFLHDFEGWAVFLFCVILLLAEVRLLLSIGRKGKFRLEYLGPAHGRIAAGHVRAEAPIIAIFVLSAAFAVVFGTHAIDRRAEQEPPHPPFFTFPLNLGEWHGRQQGLDAEVLKNLDLSDYWLANYSRGNDKAYVNFYMAYYARQRIGAEAHSPSNCIPGGGWQVLNESVKTITLEDGAPLSVTRLLIRRGEARQLVYYWFDERGRNITDTYHAKWYLLVDSMTMRRTDGALIRLVTPLQKDESEETGDVRLAGFLKVAYPASRAFIPNGSLTGVHVTAPRRADPISGLLREP